jgi:hypothetical protein
MNQTAELSRPGRLNGFHLFTGILKKTPCPANLMACFQDTIVQSRISLLKSVSEVDSGNSGPNNHHIVVNILRVV